MTQTFHFFWLFSKIKYLVLLKTFIEVIDMNINNIFNLKIDFTMNENMSVTPEIIKPEDKIQDANCLSLNILLLLSSLL